MEKISFMHKFIFKLSVLCFLGLGVVGFVNSNANEMLMLDEEISNDSSDRLLLERGYAFVPEDDLAVTLKIVNNAWVVLSYEFDRYTCTHNVDV